MTSPQQIDWLADASFMRTITHPPKARRRDPETSHRAAAKAANFVASHEAKVFAAITDAGARGACAKEIARRTGLTDVQVSRRLGDMGERGLIHRRLRDGAQSKTDFERREGCALWWPT